MTITNDDVRKSIEQWTSVAGTDRRGCGGGKGKDDSKVLENWRGKGVKSLETLLSFQKDRRTPITGHDWFFQKGVEWWVDPRAGKVGISNAPMKVGPHIELAKLAISKLITLSETDDELQQAILQVARKEKKPTKSTRALLQPVWDQFVAEAEAIVRSKSAPTAFGTNEQPKAEASAPASPPAPAKAEASAPASPPVPAKAGASAPASPPVPAKA